jgi:hypothetical protein
MMHGRAPGPYVLLFFLCFFFLLSSGRIASLDAGQQLQASVMLALTGRLSDDGRDGGPVNAGWVRSPNGRFYQAHDIGNILLMLPAAWIGATLSPLPAADDILNPPALSRAGASLACACLAALGCFWLFRLFSFYWNVRSAFLLALAFPATTIFIAYARAAWDVLGGCCFMCGVLYYSAAVLRGTAVPRHAMLVAATLAAACSFRFSLAPFIVPAACAVFFSARHRLTARSAFASALLFGALILPSLAYNFIRTGSPIRPATASWQYLQGANALTGSMLHGLYGLFLSPNRSLFLFSPILLLALIVPVTWRRLTVDQRKLLIFYGAASFAYALLISKMANWGAFGWGPRYLLPVLPVIFFAAATGLMWLWHMMKPAAVAVLIASTVMMVPPAVVNWHLATTTFPGADNPDATRPYQQLAAWRALAWGLQGRSLPVPPDAAGDRLRASTSVFPDLLLARLAASSRTGLVAALLGAIGAILVASACARRLLADDATIGDRRVHLPEHHD